MSVRHGLAGCLQQRTTKPIYEISESRAGGEAPIPTKEVGNAARHPVFFEASILKACAIEWTRSECAFEYVFVPY